MTAESFSSLGFYFLLSVNELLKYYSKQRKKISDKKYAAHPHHFFLLDKIGHDVNF